MSFKEWFENALTQEPYCWQGFTYGDIWEAGQKAEREACALVCETIAAQMDEDGAYERNAFVSVPQDGCDDCAKAIRERGEKK